jgi:hypothetical protein
LRQLGLGLSVDRTADERSESEVFLNSFPLRDPLAPPTTVACSLSENRYGNRRPGAVDCVERGLLDLAQRSKTIASPAVGFRA